MGKASPAITGFVGGEWAPQMEGRVDVERYPTAAHICQNFLPLKQGPAMFRAGTAYVQPIKNSANRAWLYRFEFSQTQAFIIEFGGGYVRFYTNHGPLLTTGNAAWNNATAYVLGNQVVSGGITYYCIAANTNQVPPNATYWYAMTPYNGSTTTAIYEIPSPYAAADLTDSLGEFTLQLAQQGDVLYIAGGYAGAGYAPMTLTRYANAPPNWQFAVYSPVDGPFADALPLVAGSEIALVVSATTGTVTISAYGGNVFSATDVGRLVRVQSQTFNVQPWSAAEGTSVGTVASYNGNNYIAQNAATAGSSPPVHTSGIVRDGPSGVYWLYTDSGYGIAQITAYISATQVTAKTLLTFPTNVVGAATTITGISNANPAVVSSTNNVSIADSVFIVGVTGMTQVNQIPYSAASGGGSSVKLAGVDSTSFGTYTGGGTLIDNASTEWQLGAWSNTTEWPRAIGFFKDRLFWAGKLNIWGSVPGEYSSMTPDFFGLQTTDSAMNELVSGVDSSSIAWLSPAITLLIGTEGGEYGLDAADYSTSPLGPDNVEILKQSQWRCRHIAPILVGTTILYIQRAGRKLLAMDYQLWLNRYDSTDQSKYAYHASIGGINAIAYQQEPFSLLWATRTDGTLLSYTFNREDQVIAWARHNIGGNGIVESIAAIPAPDGSRDELWMIVNRTVNGAAIRTVEYLTKHYEGPQAGYAGDAQSSAWYVDCGVQYVAPPSVTIINVQVTISAGATIVVYTAANSFEPGQTVQVSGVIGTGTLSPNGPQFVTTSTPTAFSVYLPGAPPSFQYVSGGMAAVNSGGGTTTISGIPSVLWNQTVNILADGGVQAQQAVSATGTLTLTGTFNIVTLGFPYQGNIVPMRPEGGADVGTSQGKLKQGTHLVLRLVDAAGGQVAQLSNQNPSTQTYQDPLGQTALSATNFEQIAYNYTTTTLDSPPPLQSGDFPISYPGASSSGSDQDSSDFYILVQQNAPLPMTVVGLFPSFKTEERQ